MIESQFNLIKLVIAASLFGLFISFSQQSLAAPKKDKIELPPVEVQSLVISDSELRIPFRYPGLVKSQVTGKLISETQGIVTKIRKGLGDPVKKGEVIFYVKNYQVGLNFKAYGVRAPVSGVIGQLDVEVGKALKPGQILGEVTRPDLLKVIVEIPANDLSQIQKDFHSDFKTEEKNIPLFIKGISPTINSNTGTAQAELRLKDNKDSKYLRSGLIGDVNIISGPQKIITLPPRAIIAIGSKFFVRVIEKNDTVKVKEVKIGRLLGKQQVILGGLTPEDEIVVKSMDHLKDGDKIKRSNQSTQKSL